MQRPCSRGYLAALSNRKKTVTGAWKVRLRMLGIKSLTVLPQSHSLKVGPLGHWQ